jgi:regulatory protein
VEEALRAARSLALAALGRRGRSRHELVLALSRKGFDPVTVRQALDSLERGGWLDDGRFAAEFVLARARHGCGRDRVRAELAARGVEGEAAEAALRGNYPAEEEAERAVQVARKKEGTIARTGRAREAALARFLRGRGFSSAAIARALRSREKGREA